MNRDNVTINALLKQLPEFPPNSASLPIVTIYVRMTPDRDENKRVISFKIPEGVDTSELHEHGLAVDGNQAIATVSPDGNGSFHGPISNSLASSLSAALLNDQKELVAFLREGGFRVQFV
jgi:hypothetical protein